MKREKTMNVKILYITTILCTVYLGPPQITSNLFLFGLMTISDFYIHYFSYSSVKYSPTLLLISLY